MPSTRLGCSAPTGCPQGRQGLAVAACGSHRDRGSCERSSCSLDGCDSNDGLRGLQVSSAFFPPLFYFLRMCKGCELPQTLRAASIRLHWAPSWLVTVQDGGRASSCASGGSGWISERISLWKGLSGIGRACPVKWWSPNPRRCLRHSVLWASEKLRISHKVASMALEVFSNLSDSLFTLHLPAVMCQEGQQRFRESLIHKKAN